MFTIKFFQYGMKLPEHVRNRCLNEVSQSVSKDCTFPIVPTQ